MAGIVALFGTAWAAAADLEDYRRAHPVLLDRAGLDVLRLLGEGRTDEAAARRLGTSVRTYRRRVGEVLRILGVTSRFQAGARARELGLRP